jgi:hypothetical protein
MRYRLRPATEADVRLIAPLLRDEDRREVEIASGHSPVISLPRSLGIPGAETLYAEEIGTGRPLIICGTAPFIPALVGVAWMLATPAALAHRKALVKDARGQIERWHEQYPLLFNLVWEGNPTHIAWLRAMGFSLIRRVELNNHNFIEFARHSPCVPQTPPDKGST